MRSFPALILAAVLPLTESGAAVRGQHAAYLGGTATLKQGIQGTLNLSGRAALVFTAKDTTLKIPYRNVTSLEFGQKIGRRVGATVALGVTTLGVGALPVLFSKKKRHYLTVEYEDGNESQAVIFELAKDTVRATLVTLEARTGKLVERDDTADLDRPQESGYWAGGVTVTADLAPTVPQGTEAAASWSTPRTLSARSEQDPSPANPAQQGQTATPAMTNVDVVRMLRSGVSQGTVLVAIRNCDPHFLLHPSATDQLLEYGVSDTIIRAMAARTHGQ